MDQHPDPTRRGSAPVPDPFPGPAAIPPGGLPWPEVPARRLRDADEAFAVAAELADAFAAGASERDRHRHLPVAEIDAFSQSGLWAVTVPRDLGGAGLGYAAVARIIAVIAAADPSLAQLPQNHLGVVQALAASDNREQRACLLDAVLHGARFGNAFSEKNSRTAGHFETRLAREGDVAVVTGRKFYCSGALLAHLVPIAAVDAAGRNHLAIARRDAPGLTVIDDWSGFGQRTTASGTVVLDGVRVPWPDVVESWRAEGAFQPDGPVSQIIQAAIDLGIARAALADTVRFVRTRSRPWIDSGCERASDDPHTIAAVGRLDTRIEAADALLERAGHVVDRAIAGPGAAALSDASIAVARAKIATTEAAMDAGNTLFELAGTGATLAEHNLDRHWRNARTHTLHDPVRWKFHAIGNRLLNDVPPPRHVWI